MTALYRTAGISKQAHLSYIKRHQQRQDKFLMLQLRLDEERSKHPAMSLKKLYERLSPQFIGRDLFIAYCREHGYETVLPRKTHSYRPLSEKAPYPNRCVDLVLIDINQLWVSDITYFKIGNVFFYIVLIMDVYSRKILGYNASANMFAQANFKALQMALKQRNIDHYKDRLIHHSDRGSQYKSLLYVEHLRDKGILVSMGNCCFDNAHMESLNGILKNEYLKHRPIHSPQDLVKFLKQDVRLYNEERPHGSLDKRTPVEFERYICNIPLEERTRLPIFADKTKANKLFMSSTDPQQLEINFPNFIL